MSRIEEKCLLRCKNRQFLPDVVPLATPFVLFIEPTNICNFECAFCPTGNKELLRQVNRRNMFMPLEVFKKIVDDLKAFPDKLKVINLWKDGESLLHPEFPDMCEYLGLAGVAENIKIRTNGTLLEKELNRRLVASGVSEIGISVEAVSDEKYFALTRRQVSYKKLISQVGELYRMREGCKIYVKIVDVNLSDAEKERFYNDFGDISDICAVEHLMGWSGENGENFKLGQTGDVGQDGNKLNFIEVCTLPFTCMALNCDGSASVCCADWMHKTVVGNVNELSVKDIWTGEALKQFRLMHLNHRRCDNEACRKCDFIYQGVDSVDGYEDKIIQRILH